MCSPRTGDHEYYLREGEGTRGGEDRIGVVFIPEDIDNACLDFFIDHSNEAPFSVRYRIMRHYRREILAPAITPNH